MPDGGEAAEASEPAGIDDATDGAASPPPAPVTVAPWSSTTLAGAVPPGSATTTTCVEPCAPRPRTFGIEPAGEETGLGPLGPMTARSLIVVGLMGAAIVGLAVLSWRRLDDTTADPAAGWTDRIPD